MNKIATLSIGFAALLLAVFALMNPSFFSSEKKDNSTAPTNLSNNVRNRDSNIISNRQYIRDQKDAINREISNRQATLGFEEFDEYFKELMINRISDEGNQDKREFELGLREKFILLEKHATPEARNFILGSWIARLKSPDDVQEFYYEGVQMLGDIELRRSSLALIIPIYFNSFENLSTGLDSRFIMDVLSRNRDQIIAISGGFVTGFENYVHDNPAKKEELVGIIDKLDFPDDAKKIIEILRQ